MLKIITAAVQPVAFSPDPAPGADLPGPEALLSDKTFVTVLDALGKMASSVAHDLNNLTTVIQGHSRLLLNASGAKPEWFHSLVQIETAAQRIAALAEQLRLFGPERVVQTLPLDLNEFLASRRQLIERQLGESHPLELDLVQEPLSIEADLEILEQIVRDLPLFARQALAAGEPLVLKPRLDPPALSQPAEPATVCLECFGPDAGLNQAVLESLFLPSGGRKAMTGFGLATIFAGVIQHGGAVEISPEAGNTCRIKILWPVSPSEPRGSRDLPPAAECHGIPKPR